MDPLKIIQKYYKQDFLAYYFLVEHSEAVAKKALEIAKKNPQFDLDINFIKEASMLHDIGIFLTKANDIGCFGDKPYICHGYLGRELLDKEGYHKHGLVCERHIGVGISIRDIKKQNLPLPQRDMIPVSMEEKIICFSDKFFSKHKQFLTKEKSINKIRKGLLSFGQDKIKEFDKLIELFNY